MKISKLSRKLMLVVAALILLNFSNCKYEDGPVFSLVTKTNRLVGEWKDVSNENVYEAYLLFEKDGRFHQSFTLNDSYFSFDGYWEWENGKEMLGITMEGIEKFELRIIRLTDKELWFEDEYNNKSKWEKT